MRRPLERCVRFAALACCAATAMAAAAAENPASPAAQCVELASPAPPFATPAQIWQAAHGDWPRALRACDDAGKDRPNDARLQFLLGRAYDRLKGYAEAARHYQIAADAKYAPAQNALGLLYVLGHGVAPDHQRAYELFSKAAFAGDAEAMGNLGSMFANGFFVKRDAAKALDWYEKAIEAGNAFGLAQAGVMYFNGQGTSRDYAAAAEYFQQAADLGDGYSMKFLALMYERGLLGKVDRAKAAELRAKAAQGDPDSQDPNVPPPARTVARAHHSASVHHVRIRRYRFNGCNWLWC